MKITFSLILLLPFTSLFAQNNKDSLLVFVGKQIEVIYSPSEQKPDVIDTIITGNDTSYIKQISFNLDKRYSARYEILDIINGSYGLDTIEFIAYDHYGAPAFSKFENALLFVSYSKGKLYHEKYQYFDLYMTVNGNWASPYSTGDYNHSYKDSITVKPEMIPFINEVSFPIHTMDNKQIKKLYPKPYFEIKNGQAIAKYGNYIEDLFKLKQQTILKARGIF